MTLLRPSNKILSVLRTVFKQKNAKVNPFFILKEKQFYLLKNLK